MPLLFSYGTLQLEDVQISTFGRRLSGSADELPGFEQSRIVVHDAEFAGTNGSSHVIVRFNGDKTSRVPGTVLELSTAELESADAYEPAPYKRVTATLASGREAWVYVDERFLERAPNSDGN
ncbi:MAG: gamma-glutamylcyclotransferase family protein [Acidobacteriota bacterium]